jgi:hypothetical protein
VKKEDLKAKIDELETKKKKKKHKRLVYGLQEGLLA